MSNNVKLTGTLNEILDVNSNFKLLKKKNIFNESLVQNLGFNLKNYGKTWIILIDNNLSKNYYEKFNYYDCCFTGQKYRKRANFQLEWSANCIFFIKCPNPKCNNWIKYEWKRKKTFLENVNLINNYPNCCEICNKNEDYKNPGLCCICNKFNFNRDSIYRGKDSYLNIVNIKTGCNCSQNWFTKHNSSKEMIEISKQNINNTLKWRKEHQEEALRISQNNIKYAHKALNDLWENNLEWSENQRKIQAENIKIAMAKQIWLWENDSEWTENMRQICIENGIKNGKKNIKKAMEAFLYLWENDLEWREKQSKILSKNGHNNYHFAHQKLLKLWENDPEWAENMKQILINNAKKMNKFLDENPEIRENNLNKLNNFLDLHPEIRIENLKKANEARLNKIKEEISNLSLNIFENSINVNNIFELRKNDICGSYIIKAKYKGDVNTEKEGNIYKLLPCKSKKMYDEIYWVLRVLSQPDKQDKNAEWTIAKWWYISNLYYDFEFKLLTDPNGVSEEEALIYEAKYAIDNDLFVEFEDKLNKIPNTNKHAYFSL